MKPAILRTPQGKTYTFEIKDKELIWSIEGMDHKESLDLNKICYINLRSISLDKAILKIGGAHHYPCESAKPNVSFSKWMTSNRYVPIDIEIIMDDLEKASEFFKITLPYEKT